MVSVSVGRQMKLSSTCAYKGCYHEIISAQSPALPRLAELPPSPADMKHIKHIKHPTSSLQQSHSSIFFSSNIH